jgi:hypothetical protein
MDRNRLCIPAHNNKILAYQYPPSMYEQSFKDYEVGLIDAVDRWNFEGCGLNSIYHFNAPSILPFDYKYCIH